MARVSLVVSALAWSMAAGSPVRAAATLVRGDANADAAFDISDPVSTLRWLFLGGPEPTCLDAADVDDNGVVEITDAIRSLGFLFLGGPAPASPFPGCGVDPSPDELTCESFPPCLANSAPHAGLQASVITGVVPLTVDFDASASADVDGRIVEHRWDFGDGGTARGERATHTFDRPGRRIVTLTVTDDGGETGLATLRIDARAPGIPPDPADVAPRLDGTSIPTFDTLVSFLHSASDPVQTGMAPDAITPVRAAVVRGRVLTRDGGPLSGVGVRVLHHPEYGATITRADGVFDLVVNGGGPLTVDYQLDGFLPAQRQVDVPWQDHRRVPDVVLISADPGVTTIELPGPMQVARGSAVTDVDGTRRATIFFPPGTTAEMVLPDGSREPLSTLHVRATEYTVGERGLEAMPGELPPTSGYTYCVEFSVDEAIAAGATTVLFSAALPSYLENFLDFPVGTTIPQGSYDRRRGTWIPEENGRVIEVLSTARGAADLDVDGDGTADTGQSLAELAITDAERRQLAALYAPGQTLWRVPVAHFSDYNLPTIPPPDAEPPPADPVPSLPADDCCRQAGNSIIEIENQILGETVRVAGTPFTLCYQSERVPGRRQRYSIDIPLSLATVPASLRRIELEISIAGQLLRQSFGPAPNQSTRFAWNGENAYGQILQGAQPVTVRIGYTYGATYGQPGRFGLAGPAIEGSIARGEITLWRLWRGKLGAWDARGNGLGGWSASSHHAYDPAEQILYRGDGSRHSARSLGSTITTYAGSGVAIPPDGDGGPATEAVFAPVGLAAAPDGSLYIATGIGNTIRRVTPDGLIETVAGNNDPCPPGAICGDGGPASLAFIFSPASVAIGPDGSLYIGQGRADLQVVRKVSPDGIISTIAGTGAGGSTGDGGPATQATIGAASGLAVGPDDSVYIADATHRRIRRVAPDGIIWTVAGTGGAGSTGDGGPATQATFITPTGVAVGRDGNLYIADAGANRVRMVSPDGFIRTIAGTGSHGFGGDGGPAIEAVLAGPTAVALGPDETIYIVDANNFRIRRMRLGGTIDTLAGSDLSGTAGDTGVARQAMLQDLGIGLAVGPDGAVYFSQLFNNVRVRRISPPTETFLAGTDGEIIVPAADGREVHVFTLGGRHQRTLDAFTGALIHRFSYDAAGRLTAITDADGNETAIERDTDGAPTAIVGAYGHVTTLVSNGDGFLERITDPAGEDVRMTYTHDGLLTSFTDPRGHVSTYAYDSMGRLVAATDPTGATKTLARTGTDADFTVAVTTAREQRSTIRAQIQDNGDQRRTFTNCDGAISESVVGQDGRLSASYADGTRVDIVLGPDPRWGMRVPVIAALTTTTPSGSTLAMTFASAATLASPGDVLGLRSRTDSLTVDDRTWTSSFDAVDRRLVLTSPAGRRTTVQLDDRGRLISSQLDGLASSTLAYDARGRLASLTMGSGASGRESRFDYGADGFLAVVTDALGRSISLRRDEVGRVMEQTLEDGRVVRFAYDPSGNLLGVTPPGRPQHTFTYTERHEVSAYTAPITGAEPSQTRYTYDADRNWVRIDQPGGSVVAIDHDDGACRVDRVDLGERDCHFRYDAAGRIEGLESSPGVSLAHTFDGQNFTGAIWSGAVTGRVTRIYDREQRLTSLRVGDTDPIAYSYDADNLLSQVGELVFERSADNGLITATSLRGARDSVVYNEYGEPESFSASHDGATLYSVAYRCDALGRIVEKSEMILGSVRIFAYSYDLAGRLEEVRVDGTIAAGYSYDANGNRLSRSDVRESSDATYDAQDRLVDFGSTTYTHNARGARVGKLAEGQATSYRYDAQGNLIGVTLPDGTQIEYLLDALDRRVGKRVDGALAQAFLYQDGLRPVAELDGAGAVVSQFIYAVGGTVPDYLIRGGATYRIITDQTGSPRLVFDVATGEVAQRMDHDEFGRVVLDSRPGFQPFGFAGGLYDRHTGLVHFGAREYDPEAGRWTSKDPIGFGGGDGNLYAYAANDPINNVDPGGLIYSSLCNPKALAAIGAATGAAVRLRETIRGAGPAIARLPAAAADVTSRITCVVTSATERIPTLLGMGRDTLVQASNATLQGLGQAGPALARAAPNLRQLYEQARRFDAWGNSLQTPADTFWQGWMDASRAFRDTLSSEQSREAVMWISRWTESLFR